MTVEDLSLHILDIAENSVTAGARCITITVVEDRAADLLAIELTDDGHGMQGDDAVRAADPFYTTRSTRRLGLGLALLREAAEAADGSLTIQSAAGKGTTVRAEFRFGHIDRKPLGSMPDTITTLVATHTGIRIRYRHIRDGRSLLFDTEEIRREAGTMALNTGAALGVIREHLRREEHALAH